MVHRIIKLDVPSQFAGIAPSWLLKVFCALLGVCIAAILRIGADRLAPGVAPYTFVYPASLLATLLGGWEAGLGTLLICVFLTWHYVVPQAARVGTLMRYQDAAMLMAVFTGTLMVAVGEGFRAAARRVVQERNAKLAQRDLLFRELQHRVGNDFAIVSSLLDLQRRRSDIPETRSALENAIGRIHSISRIHRQIYALPGNSSVDLRQYLQEICTSLTGAVLPPTGVSLHCECEPVEMPRERALALGLAANELITNAIKHAFPDGREGAIYLRFARGAAGWQFSVRDNGIGMLTGLKKGGLGTGLISQFVSQAQGVLRIECEEGTLAIIELPSSAASSIGISVGELDGVSPYSAQRGA